MVVYFYPMGPCKVLGIYFHELIFMQTSFVVSEGISSGAKFEADIPIVARVLDMARLNVFVQVRIVLSVIVTIRAGPTRQLLHHFTPDHHIDI